MASDGKKEVMTVAVKAWQGINHDSDVYGFQTAKY